MEQKSAAGSIMYANTGCRVMLAPDSVKVKIDWYTYCESCGEKREKEKARK
jgi:hypothetical protein